MEEKLKAYFPKQIIQYSRTYSAAGKACVFIVSATIHWNFNNTAEILDLIKIKYSM